MKSTTSSNASGHIEKSCVDRMMQRCVPPRERGRVLDGVADVQLGYRNPDPSAMSNQYGVHIRQLRVADTDAVFLGEHPSPASDDGGDDWCPQHQGEENLRVRLVLRQRWSCLEPLGPPEQEAGNGDHQNHVHHGDDRFDPSLQRMTESRGIARERSVGPPL